MNTDRATGLLHGTVTDRILKIFYEVYNELGYGFLESVYCRALTLALRAEQLRVTTEVPIAVHFRGECIGEFRCDIVVEDCVIVEVKAVSALTQVHEAQLVNYLKATGVPVGLILNFGPKAAFRRRIFDLSV